LHEPQNFLESWPTPRILKAKSEMTRDSMIQKTEFVFQSKRELLEQGRRSWRATATGRTWCQHDFISSNHCRGASGIGGRARCSHVTKGHGFDASMEEIISAPSVRLLLESSDCCSTRTYDVVQIVRAHMHVNGRGL
jgi:hypothetical protein